MRWPQIAILVWMALVVLVAANQHGKLREGRWSFWWVLASAGLEFFLLLKGGFFGH